MVKQTNPEVTITLISEVQSDDGVLEAKSDDVANERRRNSENQATR